MHNAEKLSQLRKWNMGYHPTIFQQNWLAQAREAKATAQAPTVVILTQQAEMSFTFTQPATAPVAHTQPLITMSNQTQKSPGFCATCTPVRKQCHTEYPMALKLDWSDSEEEKDFKKQSEAEEEIEDWDANIQKQRTKTART